MKKREKALLFALCALMLCPAASAAETETAEITNWTDEDGTMYTGIRKEGKLTGHGVKVAADEDSGFPINYVGEFLDGEETGYGVLVNNRGYYIGELYQGEFNGFGAYYGMNSDRVIVEEKVGMWENGEYQESYQEYIKALEDAGEEVQYLLMEDGSIYAGDLEGNVRSGQGWYFDAPTRSIYVGQWENDDKNGNGRGYYIDEGGKCFVGEWKNGVEHGTGTKFGSFGECYVGEWKDGYRDGTGTIYLWSGGYRYAGEWKNDEWNGTGTCYFEDGSSVTGEFEEKRLSQVFTYHSPSGEEAEVTLDWKEVLNESYVWWTQKEYIQGHASEWIK